MLGCCLPRPQAHNRLADNGLTGLQHCKAVKILRLASRRVPIFDAFDAGRNVLVLRLPVREKKYGVARLLRFLQIYALLSKSVLTWVHGTENVNFQHLVVDKNCSLQLLHRVVQ